MVGELTAIHQGSVRADLCRRRRFRRRARGRRSSQGRSPQSGPPQGRPPRGWGPITPAGRGPPVTVARSTGRRASAAKHRHDCPPRTEQVDGAAQHKAVEHQQHAPQPVQRSRGDVIHPKVIRQVQNKQGRQGKVIVALQNLDNEYDVQVPGVGGSCRGTGLGEQACLGGGQLPPSRGGVLAGLGLEAPGKPSTCGSP